MSLILLVLQIIISILLIIVILLQRSDSDGLGLGASGGSNFLSSRGQANLMTKITSILAIAFMANSLLLATINARSGEGSIANEIMLEQSKDFQVPTEQDVEVKDVVTPLVKVPAVEVPQQQEKPAEIAPIIAPAIQKDVAPATEKPAQSKSE